MSGHLTTDQRAELSRRIAELRRRATSRLAALERDHDAIVTGSADAVRDDEHDPEGATIAFERAQVATLRGDAETSLRELDRSERRLEEPGFGTCERCALPIAYERLLARPTATRCTACAG
jgi:DnaK suppressor protein